MLAYSRYIFEISYQLDLDLYQQTFTDFVGISNNLSSSPSADQSYTIQPIGKAVAEAGNARGGNPLGLSAVPQTCKLFPCPPPTLFTRANP